jgi:capsular exopolysaccharide synthesis family protein
MSASSNKRYLITHQSPRSQISEQYRTLRTNIQFSSIDSPVQTLLVTSTNPGEGKTTLVANLAVTYAQENKNVLIVDADLRKPTQHLYFFQSNRTGLSHLLSNQCSLYEAVSETTVENLSIITSGPIPPNPAELLSSRRMRQFMEEIKEHFDIILIDSPPVLAVTDAQILAAQSDGVIVVLGAGKVKRDHARKTLAALEHVKANVLGTVLNNRRGRPDSYNYYYYGYGYGYGYGHKNEG